MAVAPPPDTQLLHPTVADLAQRDPVIQVSTGQRGGRLTRRGTLKSTRKITRQGSHGSPPTGLRGSPDDLGAAAGRADLLGVQRVAGQRWATQRQLAGYELDTAQRVNAAIGAQLPAVRVVIAHRSQVPVHRLVSQPTPTKYAQAATSAVTASPVTEHSRGLPQPLDHVLGRQPHPALADRWIENIPIP